MPNYHTDTLTEFWGALSDAITGKEFIPQREITRQSNIYALRIFLEERGAKREAVHFYVNYRQGLAVKFWEFSELPVPTEGEDVRSLTVRWCADIYKKTDCSLSEALMQLMPVNSIVARRLPDFEDMVTCYSAQVGNTGGPKVEQPAGWVTP